MDRKDNLIHFPPMKDNIYRERIYASLMAFKTSDEEFEAVDAILCSLYDFFISLEDPASETIALDIAGLRGKIDVLYENISD